MQTKGDVSVGAYPRGPAWTGSPTSAISCNLTSQSRPLGIFEMFPGDGASRTAGPSRLPGSASILTPPFVYSLRSASLVFFVVYFTMSAASQPPGNISCTSKYGEMSIKQLKKELRRRKAKLSGRKADLVAR